MPPVRVLIVDDSVVVRRMLSEIITSESDLEVAGSAATASIGIQKINQVNPDVVLLDVEMPEMDGIEAVAKIRASWPRLPVIMCSSLTERGADTTLRALSAGASDYVAKPSSASGRDAREVFAAELKAKIRGLSGREIVVAPSPPRVVTPTPSVAAMRAAPKVPSRIEVLAIGCSTGGPNALGVIFPKLPGDLPVPIVLVQHMPPLFTRMLAERLSASSPVNVKEAEHGDVLEPGRAYIAPGNFHMVVSRQGLVTRLLLNQDAPENSCRPAVDVLFRSVGRVYGATALGVVLTGMGQDGTRGARDIVEAGGSVFVQDAASCVVPSMPMSVFDAGMAERVIPLDRMATELTTRIRASRSSTTRPSFSSSLKPQAGANRGLV